MRAEPARHGAGRISQRSGISSSIGSPSIWRGCRRAGEAGRNRRGRARCAEGRARPAGAGADPARCSRHAADLLFDHSLFNGHPRFSATSRRARRRSACSAICWRAPSIRTAARGICRRWRPRSKRRRCDGLPSSSDSRCLASTARRREGGRVARERRQHGELRVLSGGAHREGRMGRAKDRPQRQPSAAGDLRLRRKRTRGFRKPRTCLASAPMRSAGLPVDEQQRMKTAELRRQIEADRARGDRPFLVVGTAGSVSTGAVDPLPEIAAICREHDLWFHVDGAYGALAAAIPGAPADLRGLAEADSVAVDPHKWLYAPLEAGCALVRRPEDLRNAFSYHPPYYRFDEEALNFVDYGPQNSRGFRALKVWLALQQIGRAGYVESIAEDMRLSRKLFELLQKHAEFEALTQNLSITTFRYVPPRSPFEARRPGGGGVAEHAERRAARARREERQGVLLERGHRRKVCAARLHRELPHVGRRHRSGARARRGAGTEINILSAERKRDRVQSYEPGNADVLLAAHVFLSIHSPRRRTSALPDGRNRPGSRAEQEL